MSKYTLTAQNIRAHARDFFSHPSFGREIFYALFLFHLASPNIDEHYQYAVAAIHLTIKKHRRLFQEVVGAQDHCQCQRRPQRHPRRIYDGTSK